MCLLSGNNNLFSIKKILTYLRVCFKLLLTGGALKCRADRELFFTFGKIDKDYFPPHIG